MFIWVGLCLFCAAGRQVKTARCVGELGMQTATRKAEVPDTRRAGFVEGPALNHMTTVSTG